MLFNVEYSNAKPVEVPELKGDEYMATECVRRFEVVRWAGDGCQAGQCHRKESKIVAIADTCQVFVRNLYQRQLAAVIIGGSGQKIGRANIVWHQLDLFSGQHTNNPRKLNHYAMFFVPSPIQAYSSEQYSISPGVPDGWYAGKFCPAHYLEFFME